MAELYNFSINWPSSFCYCEHAAVQMVYKSQVKLNWKQKMKKWSFTIHTKVWCPLCFFEWGIDTPANAHYDLIAITTVYLRKLKRPHFINIFITKISACHIKIFCNKERKHRLFVNTDYWVMSTKIRKYLKKTALYVSLFRKEIIT